MNKCNVDEWIIQILTDAMQINKSLKALHLENNKITRKGAAEIAKVLVEEGNFLSSIFLKNNKINDVEAIEFAQALKY